MRGIVAARDCEEGEGGQQGPKGRGGGGCGETTDVCFVLVQAWGQGPRGQNGMGLGSVLLSLALALVIYGGDAGGKRGGSLVERERAREPQSAGAGESG